MLPVAIVLWGGMAFAQTVNSGLARAKAFGNPECFKFELTGGPLSVEFVKDSSRVSAKGKPISTETRELFYRDSEGRTRFEAAPDNPASSADQHHSVSRYDIAPKHVLIMDPVRGVVINLDETSGIAEIHHVSHPQPAPSTADYQAGTSNRRRSTKIEHLGNMQIDGFKTVGTRTTQTIKADAEGNEQPIVRTTEIWFSPDLKVSLLSKIEDSQIGERITKTIDIKNADPAPALFQVPADYTVKDDQPQ